MRKRVRFFLLIFALLTAGVSALFFWYLVNPVFGTSFLLFLYQLRVTDSLALTGGVVSAVVFIAAVLTIVYAWASDRLKKTRVSSTETGQIDVGINAIESIALNAAQLAQAGVKSAKARVHGAKNNEISITLIVVLYSDVEIRAQMSALQDRVKKDVERYTGIPVAGVTVKVSRVELVGTRIGH